MKRTKWTALAMLTGGAMLLANGCLGAFWQGFATEGFPGNNRWLNIAFDVVNEIVLG